MFEFLLGVELDRQFREHDDVVVKRPCVGPMRDLRAGPFRPVGISGQNVGDDAGAMTLVSTKIMFILASTAANPRCGP